MKHIAAITLVFFCLFNLSAQEEKEKKKFKMPKMNIGEKIGNLTGNLMTGKSDDLAEVSVKASYICSVYPPEIATSEAKYFPKGTYEGDYLASITFFKQEGMGLYEILGEVTCEGEPMEYVGMGSYLTKFPIPSLAPVKIEIKTETGDEASFMLHRTPEIEILTVNGDQFLPILDLAEDIELEYYNPEGSEGTRVRVSLITDVMGARALNHFAEFTVAKAGIQKVTIPKESLANPEIAGQLNTGQFNKGENFLIVEREVITGKEKYGADQNPGEIATSELKTVSYASIPVIVKGKQEEGIMASLKVRARTEDKTLGYEFYKPNATTGIPFSKASKFGLVSFTMSASTFKQESETSERSWTVGDTKYTQTTTTTTTYEFPQLPAEHWEYVMDRIYKDVAIFFSDNYEIDFVPVEDVVNTPQYATLFPANEELNKSKVAMSYKGTQRVNPEGIFEVFGSISSNQTADNPKVNMMKAAGELDGLMSMHIELQVAGNKEGHVVLIPKFTISISGRDENNNSKQGKYVDGYVVRTTGEPFNGDLLKTSKEELLRVCSHETILMAMQSGIAALRAKEIEMGYDKIWNIGVE
ncbi:MAG: hypothetical protein CMB80_15165 [Flammeovirgaceae bacterium]|nr:hypothetical protein [Flammeovirgaceae bacterium]MBE63792.1 hypothetical protein [Flammeovirgaceae bacterium]HCX24469.1 hypothetical protein [Cytophagales bacterium]|tara:strand:- start:3246 stop:5000 length:1755 start_codon:yes stop_codon:yes gene_type:complete